MSQMQESQLRQHQKSHVYLGPVNEIIFVLCRRYGLRPSEIKGSTHAKKIVKPRHIGYLLAMELGHSASHVGRVFRRDHSTIRHCVDLMRKRIANNPDLADEVDMIRGLLPKECHNGFDPGTIG